MIQKNKCRELVGEDIDTLLNAEALNLSSILIFQGALQHLYFKLFSENLLEIIEAHIPDQKLMERLTNIKMEDFNIKNDYDLLRKVF
jgi:hypothetical protein